MVELETNLYKLYNDSYHVMNEMRRAQVCTLDKAKYPEWGFFFPEVQSDRRKYALVETTDEVCDLLKSDACKNITKG